ncbi:MAG: cytochrome C oxidase subunit IV family protein [Luteolibacter sp.]
MNGNLITLISLLTLTAGTALVAGASHGVVAILFLAMAKILLVTFRFMDLRHAHLFWKCSVSLLTCAFLVTLGLLANL